MEDCKITKNQNFNIRTNSFLKAKAKEVARKKGLSLTEYITELIKADMRSQDISISLSAKLV